VAQLAALVRSEGEQGAAVDDEGSEEAACATEIEATLVCRFIRYTKICSSPSIMRAVKKLPEQPK